MHLPLIAFGVRQEASVEVLMVMDSELRCFLCNVLSCRLRVRCAGRFVRCEQRLLPAPNSVVDVQMLHQIAVRFQVDLADQYTLDRLKLHVRSLISCVL